MTAITSAASSPQGTTNVPSTASPEMHLFIPPLPRLELMMNPPRPGEGGGLSATPLPVNSQSSLQDPINASAVKVEQHVVKDGFKVPLPMLPFHLRPLSPRVTSPTRGRMTSDNPINKIVKREACKTAQLQAKVGSSTSKFI